MTRIVLQEPEERKVRRRADADGMPKFETVADLQAYLAQIDAATGPQLKEIIKQIAVTVAADRFKSGA